MIVLKAQTFHNADDLVKFVNINAVKREDVLEITTVLNAASATIHSLFFYGDSEKEEINKGFFGW